jgi:hypothetical protein
MESWAKKTPETPTPFMPQTAGCGKGDRQKKGAAGFRCAFVACTNRFVGRYFFRALRIFLSSAVLNTTVILPRVGLP